MGRARSVELSSPRLGLVGRADVLEGVDGSVRVVEVKKGRPHPSNAAWEADQLQAGVLALLLREEGYRCE